MKRTLIACAALTAAVVLPFAPVEAGVELPAPAQSFSFENSLDNTVTGGFPFYWDNSGPVYVDSLRTEAGGTHYKALQIGANSRPAPYSYSWPSNFTIVLFASVENMEHNGGILCSVGDSIFLKCVDGKLRFGTNDVYREATVAFLQDGYHLFVVRRGSDGSFSLQIDGGKKSSGSGLTQANISGVQLGAKWNGGSYVAGDGALIDEFAIYSSVLSDEQVAELVKTYPACFSAYTADLSASTVDEISYSGLSWNRAGTPAEGDTEKIIVPSAGLSLTMDTATPALASMKIGGEGALSVVAGEGITSPAITTAAFSAETDVNLSGVGSSLGALTITTGKTLTVGAATITSLTTAQKRV